MEECRTRNQDIKNQLEYEAVWKIIGHDMRQHFKEGLLVFRLFFDHPLFEISSHPQKMWMYPDFFLLQLTNCTTKMAALLLRNFDSSLLNWLETHEKKEQRKNAMVLVLFSSIKNQIWSIILLYYYYMTTNHEKCMTPFCVCLFIR